MKLGDMVYCTAYIKHSGNHYEIYDEKQTQDRIPACFYWKRDSAEGISVDDFHNCDRYITINKRFNGIYVGTTELCTRLNAEYIDAPYGRIGYRTYCDQPQKFAVVYYANNKKRIVPINHIESIKENV